MTTETKPHRRATPTGTGLILPQLLVLVGMAAWLTLIMINNITDSGTNIHLIGRVLTMEDMVGNPHQGQGLLGRALSGDLAAPALYGVIAYQAVSSALLWWAAAAHLLLALGRGDGTRATRLGNVALSALAGLALMFLVGGLWFGYWITFGPVQQVHFTLLLVAVGGLVLVNLPRERAVV
ncbi:DUF2165 family protein [Nocardiopsis terrae]